MYGAIFGSAARGAMRVDSDIDLLLVRPEECDRDRWDDLVATLAADVTAWTGNDTRVLEFGESEVLGSGRHEPVLKDVDSHGLTVAGKPAWLRRAITAKEPNDAPN